MEYLTGNFILGWEGIQSVELTMHWFKSHWDQIVIPLYVGTAFYSIVVSTLVYLIVNWLWVRSAQHEWKQRRR